VHLLELTDEEAKVLAFVVHLGATAFDVPGEIQSRHLLVEGEEHVDR
jgi:hypothetical protein